MASNSPGQTGLHALVGRGAAWQLLNVVLGRSGQLVLGIVIARIVSPETFGVFALAIVVQSVLVNLSDLGVSSALIRGTADARATSTVFTISVATSAALATCMWLSSAQLAALLGTPAAAEPIAVLSLTLALIGVGAAPSALLRRDFRQDRLLVGDLGNLVVSGVAVVALALLGWGPLALAWSRVAGQLFQTICLLRMSPEPLRFGWDSTQSRQLIAFGLPLGAANLLSWLVLNSDYVAVNHLAGTVALGYYLLAFNISGWPLGVFGTVIRSVSLPAFGRLREQPRERARALSAGTEVVAILALPTCLMLGALAEPLVVLLYGARWAAAATALVTLSLFAAVRSMTDLLVDFLIALGLTKHVLVVQVLWLIALIPALYVSISELGIAGAGLAHLLVAALVVLPAYLILARRLQANLLEILRLTFLPLVAAVAAAAAAHLAANAVNQPLLALAVGGSVGAALYVALMSRRLRTLHRTLNSARDVKRGLTEPVLESV